jgi:hypothetical protein
VNKTSWAHVWRLRSRYLGTGYDKKGQWVEVMHMAVWSHNSTTCRASKFTPFPLLFEAEAVLLEEIRHRSLRIKMEVPPCLLKRRRKICWNQKGSKQ